MNADGVKTCKHCGVTKSLAEFHSNGGGTLRPECGACFNAKRMKRYYRYHDVYLQRQKLYRERVGAEEWNEHNRKWREANPDYYARNIERLRANGRRKAAKRRAVLAGVTVDDVDAKVVFARDHGLCGICGLPVDPEKYQLDHIVPLVRGGEHSYANIQLAHGSCNRKKGAR